jgi:hypothetical protein
MVEIKHEFAILKTKTLKGMLALHLSNANWTISILFIQDTNMVGNMDTNITKLQKLSRFSDLPS